MLTIKASSVVVLTIAVLLYNNQIAGIELKNTYTKCCRIGENLANSGRPCNAASGPVMGIAAEQQSVCLSFLELCCTGKVRDQQCKAGITIAKAGKMCASSADAGTGFNIDCCEACKIGLVAGSSGAGCDPQVFGVGPPSDTAYKQCCEETVRPIPDTSPVFTNTTMIKNAPMPTPELDSLCDLLPGSLCSHICVPVPGSYVCQCRPGFTLMADKKSCYRAPTGVIDRCKEMNPCDHQCVDTGVAIQCLCDKGYELDSDKISCIDIDECSSGIATCETNSLICVNTKGSYTCLPNDMENELSSYPCPPGYEFSQQKNSCIDVDECTQRTDDCNHESQWCLNTIGNFTCQNKASKTSCPPGFRMNPTTEACEDIDECAIDKFCVGNEICINEQGGYRCEPTEATIPNRPVPTFPAIKPRESTPAPTQKQVLTTQLIPTQSAPVPISCAAGYRPDASGNCADINECEEDENYCDSGQDCFNLMGSFDCRCKIGFQLEHTGACADVNECQVGNNNCVSGQRCDNTIGSYQCIRLAGCGTGYTLNAASNLCEDDDECALQIHNCESPHFQCRNTPGSFRCDRKRTTIYATRRTYISQRPVNSYRHYSRPTTPKHNLHDPTNKDRYDSSVRSENGITPSEPRENPVRHQGSNAPTSSIHNISTKPRTTPLIPTNLDPNPAGNSTQTTRMISRKTCFPGYKLNNRGDCEDINECLDQNICQMYNGRCVNHEGGYQCERQCPHGHQLNAERTQCEDIDECKTGHHSCDRDQICENRIGGYLCQCQLGFSYNHGTNACQDIDECERFQGRICSNSRCVNIVGSFRCDCNPGFRSLSSSECMDINECNERPGICHHNCHNIAGSYRCSCKQGFVLSKDNRTCIDTDECVEFKDANLCVGFCVNTPGSYTCQCPPGYRLGSEGRTCIDIDECLGGGVCLAGQTCYNMRGTYRCNQIVCPDGYQLDRTSRNRCERNCNQSRCSHGSSTISYNYMTFGSMLPVIRSIDLFTMRGPSWTTLNVDFTMNMKAPIAPPGVQPADPKSFKLRLADDTKQAIVSLEKSIEGPQDIELTITMNMYQYEKYQGNAIAKLFVFVTEYTF